MKRLAIFLIASVLVIVLQLESAAAEKWQSKPGNCVTGLHHQTDGPFAALLFCEDALGDYLAVVDLDPIRAPATYDGKWTLNDRYWHEEIWGSDITGFQWSKDGKKLYVSTEGVYGAGGFFELDLKSRSWVQRLPKDRRVSINNPGPGYDIDGVALKEPK